MIFIRIQHDPDALEESPDSFGLPLFPRATAYSLGVFCLSRLNYSRAPLSPGQPSLEMKANEWSSPTWSCSSASSSDMMFFRTTSTCARSSPAATWPLTPTCRALAPPSTSPPTNPNAKSRKRAATWRWRHDGEIHSFFFSSVSVCYLFILLTKTDLFFTGHWSVRVHGDWSQLKCTLWWGK